LKKLTTIQLFKQIEQLVHQSRKDLYQIANTTLVETNFHIGRMIVEHEQQGKIRADYAQKILPQLSVKSTKALGKGFSVDSFENIRKFYLVYGADYQTYLEKQAISEALPLKLGKAKKRAKIGGDILVNNC
jgi:predicted GNAT family N-acyltransferase